jgi:hypothetical protein
MMRIAALALVSLAMLAQKPDSKAKLPTLPAGTREYIQLEIKEELARLRQDLQQELRAELRTQLRQELRAELKQELRSELRSELKQELRQELRMELSQELRMRQ